MSGNPEGTRLPSAGSNAAPVQAASAARLPTDAFEVLRTRVLPAIFAARESRDTIRVWVPGCATGEEAYSIAIEIAEYRARTHASNPFQIFASDITPSALATARAGIYPASISDRMPAERLERYFVNTHSGYRVTQDLRDTCVFATHDVLNDPPLSPHDLILCADPATQLPALQPRVFDILHDALLPTGYLLLGHADSTLFRSEGFAPLEAMTCLFTRRETAHRSPRPPTGQAAAEPVDAAGIIAMQDQQLAELRRELSETREQASTLIQEHAVRLQASHNATQEALSNSEAMRRGEAHKMEAIARFAGGVAHDFNNVFTVITGHVELMLHQLNHADPLHPQLVQLRMAAERAEGVTRQLLAVSQRQVLQPRRLDLNLVVHELEPALRRLLADDITLALDLHPAPHWVHADPSLMGQVILNLVRNSRDAIQHRGRVTLATAPIRSPGPADTTGDLPAGSFVLLRVEDDGVGMSPETLARCFEPFFTTKPTGEATGLGLATVYGIVEQSGGKIRVHSEPGKGATFSIYLPVSEAAVQSTQALAAHPAAAAHGTGTILFVEDEPAIRTLGRMILEQRGYHVLLAANGREALELADRHAEPIALLISDVRMPIMSGRELARLMRARRPGIRTLYISGYTEDEDLKEDIESAQAAYLHKPFTPAALTELVRALFAASGPLSP